ncbi:hypothetical protein P879_01054 [Paragonimus westermani]|uniref:Uncharacterized protein n=1 Tax=Paragonimus westermani TaxID=34504 RepID=A0A8T0DLF7_9TREM|nr:hypothetical protein P879_01054 [Paragonimus westermani]
MFFCIPWFSYPESDDSSNDPPADRDHRMVTPVEAVDLLRRQICLPRDILDAFQLGLTAASLSHITDTIQPIDSSMVSSKGGFCFQVVSHKSTEPVRSRSEILGTGSSMFPISVEDGLLQHILTGETASQMKRTYACTSLLERDRWLL